MLYFVDAFRYCLMSGTKTTHYYTLIDNIKNVHSITSKHQKLEDWLIKIGLNEDEVKLFVE